MRTSGGLIYHWRSLRYGKDAKSLWASHFEGVEKFLRAWNPPEKTLLLIGPSGGYSLPKSFLERFETIIAVEPDVLARLIFKKRFGIEPGWIKNGISFHDLKSFYPFVPKDAAILFSNVLGQVRLPRIAQVRPELKKLLEHHSWASYHDAMSGDTMQFDFELASPGRKSTLAEMKKMIYPMGGESQVLNVNAHEAPDLFPAEPKLHFHYWQWRLTPKRAHLIEGVFINRRDPILEILAASPCIFS